MQDARMIQVLVILGEERVGRRLAEDALQEAQEQISLLQSSIESLTEGVDDGHEDPAS